MKIFLNFPKKKKKIVHKPNSPAFNPLPLPLESRASLIDNDPSNLIMEKLNKSEKNNERLFKAVIELHKVIMELREEVQVMKKMIKKNNSFTIDSSSKIPKLPVKSQHELELLEEILLDEHEVNNLKMKLTNFGGSQLRSTINNMVKNSISSEVAVQFSLQGKCDKLAFKDLKLCSCIQG